MKIQSEKDFTILERYEIRKALEPLEKQKAVERMLLGKPSADSTKGKGRVLDNISNLFGISRDTLNKETEIIEAVKENPEQFGNLLEKIDSGDTSINYAYQMVTRAEDHKNPPQLPQGEFDIIYVDPPWTYDISLRGSAKNHYSTMTDEQIQNLKIPTAENAILFLWTTSVKEPIAFEVIEAWGFEYKSMAVWVKPNIGNGYYFKQRHELLLVAVKGKMPLPQEHNRVDSVIEAPTKEHSQKPEIVYQIIEQMHPNRTYLELFARRQRQGWSSWGNELIEVKTK